MITNVIRKEYGGDEAQFAVTVKNPLKEEVEVRVSLLNNIGESIDKEPDWSWKDIPAGQSRNFVVSTRATSDDINDLKPSCQIIAVSQDRGKISDRIVHNWNEKTKMQGISYKEGQDIMLKQSPDIPTSGAMGSFSSIFAGAGITVLIVVAIIGLILLKK